MQALAWLRLSGCLDGAGGLPGSSRLTRWRWAGLGITRLSRKVAQNNRLSARWSVLGSSLRKWAAKIDARSPRCGDGEFCAIKKGKRPARQSPLGHVLIHGDGLGRATAGAEEQIAPSQANSSASAVAGHRRAGSAPILHPSSTLKGHIGNQRDGLPTFFVASAWSKVEVM